MEKDAEKLSNNIPLWVPDQVQEFGPVSAPFAALKRSSTLNGFAHLSITGLSGAVEDGSICMEVFLDYIDPEKRKNIH